MIRRRRLARLASDERGEGIVSALILLAGALLPLIYLILVFSQIEQGNLAVSQAAQAAVRAATQASDATAAQQAAEQELAAEQAQTATPMQLDLTGSFERGGVLAAQVTGEIPVGRLPFLGHLGTITVRATAQAPVDEYRSLTGAGQ